MRHRQVVWWIWWSWKLEPGIAQNRADLRSGSISKSKSPKATCNFNYPHLMATSFYVWVRFLKWWFQSLTQLWFFDWAPIMTGLARYVYGLNSGTNIMGDSQVLSGPLHRKKLIAVTVNLAKNTQLESSEALNVSLLLLPSKYLSLEP